VIPRLFTPAVPLTCSSDQSGEKFSRITIPAPLADSARLAANFRNNTVLKPPPPRDQILTPWQDELTCQDRGSGIRGDEPAGLDRVISFRLGSGA